MTATTKEYAQLAAYVYKTTPKNELSLPSGWEPLELIPDQGDGFSAGVFRRIGFTEIVISYTGTNDDKITDTRYANLPAALGQPSGQVLKAMLLYERIKATPGYGDNISFTGHSLGGGLAGLMAVYFNKDSTTFDAAPFQASALNTSTLNYYKSELLAKGYVDANFNLYNDRIYPLPPSTFSSREAKVTGYHLEGEFLNVTRNGLTTIYGGTENEIRTGPTALTAFQLHSMVLLSATQWSTDFANVIKTNASILNLAFDKKLYFKEDESDPDVNFLNLALNSEVKAGSSGGQGMLTKFSEDLQKLGTNLAGLNKAAQDAIIAQGIEWYYWQGTGYAGQKFFVNNATYAGLLQYNSAVGAGLQNAKDKAFIYVDKWLTPLYNANGAFGGRNSFDQWSVVTNNAAVEISARDNTKSQIFIGQDGADKFTGGVFADVLMGGGGADTLDGGTGYDLLHGGAGNDEYIFTGAFGADVIQDSDSAGLIKVDGTTLTGGKKVDDNVWESADGVYRYQLFSHGATNDLVIGRGSKATASDMQGSIVIKGWTGTGLGITLDTAAPLVPPGLKNYNGDQRGVLAGIAPDQYYNWGTTSWDEATGILTNGVAEVNFADVIFASAVAGDNTVLHGNGGNDALSGSASKDEIFGDGGDDLIGGGAGSDNISGGAGNDYIFGSGSVTAPQRGGPNDTWPAAGQPAVPANATIITQGKTWGVYTVPTSNGSAMTIIGISAGAQDAAPDIIDAGDGDDHVYAGRGVDYIDGGLGSDAIFGGGAGDVIEGGDDRDYIWGDGQISQNSYSYTLAADHGADFIDGGAGNDQLVGGGGNDEIYGGVDDDQLHGDEFKEIYLSGSYHGNDYLDGEAGNDDLFGDGGDDLLWGGTGNDTLTGDAGRVDLAGEWHGNDYLDGEDGADVLSGGGKDDILYGGLGNDTMWGDAGTNALYNIEGEFQGNDYLDGEDGDDFMFGDGKDDILMGGLGADILYGDNTQNLVAGGFHGNDDLDGGDGNDSLYGGGKDDILVGGAGNDVLEGDDLESDLAGNFHGNDNLDGGDGDDTLFGEGGNDYLSGGAGADILNGDARISDLSGQFHGNDYLDGGDGNDVLSGQGGNDSLYGGAGNDTLQGDALASDVPAQFHGADYLDGGDGDDLLLGGGGADTLSGGIGGRDTLYGGSGDDLLVSDSYFDYLYGEEGNDTLIDGDDMNGGAGQDTYKVSLSNFWGSDIFGDTGDGNVLIMTGGLTPSDLAVRKVGLSSNFILVNLLTGSTLTIHKQATAQGVGALISEVHFESTPGTVWTAANMKLMAMTGDGGNNRIWGYEAATNSITGGDGQDELYGGNLADTLDGGTGADYLEGGLGIDTYIFGLNAGADRIKDITATGGNIVQLQAGVTAANLQLFRTGQTGANTTGTSDSLVLLIPSTGAQLWIDEYFQPNSTGTVSEIRFGDGSGMVWQYADIVGRAGTTASGAQNTQTGTTANNVFVVDNGADLIVEAANGGTDSVQSSVSYTLPVNVENLELIGMLAVNGIGNSGDNILRGNDGNNTLRGSDSVTQFSGGNGGNDQYFGGKGDDVYFDGADHNYYANYGRNARTLAIVELPSEGVDTIITDAYAMTMPENVERLIVKSSTKSSWFPYSVFNYVGNSSNNYIDLSGSAVVYYNEEIRINGGMGDDTMIGSSQHTTFVVDSVGDVVIQSPNSSDGDVESSVPYVLDSSFRGLKLLGDSAINGTGNQRNNTLDGTSNSAANVLTGLAGDDTYYLGIGDTFVETANGGYDTIFVTAATFSSIPSIVQISDFPNIESLRLANDIGVINLRGDAGNNILMGSKDSNTIDGLDGDDIIVNIFAKVDVYHGMIAKIDDYATTSVDYLNGGNGNDTIYSFGGRNFISGGSGNDVITSNGGYETIDAGAGNDKIISSGSIYTKIDGGAGDDELSVSKLFSVQLGLGSGNDLVSHASSLRAFAEWSTLRDTRSSIELVAGTDASNLRFAQSGTSLVVNLAGSNDSVTIAKFFDYTYARPDIDSVRLPDGTVLTWDAIAAGLGRTELQVATAGNDLLIASATNHTVSGGAGEDQLFGQNANDQLNGGTGADRLYGGAGADELTGGAENDYLVGGHGMDTYVFSLGWGQDIIDEIQNVERPIASFEIPRIFDDDATDLITFDSTVSAADISATSDGSSLFLTHKVTGDKITVLNYFFAASNPVGQVELIRFSDNTVWDRTTVDQLIITVMGTGGDDTLYALSYTGSDVFGLAGQDSLFGGGFNDRLYGGAGNDVLTDAAGDNLLDGGIGADQMHGGSGNDTFVVDDVGDVVTDYPYSPVDTILASITFGLPDYIENLTLLGIIGINATGNALDNVLTGNVAANQLTGGAGNDTYVVGLGDTTTELAGGGNDTVLSSISWTLADEVEVLTLIGTSAIDGTGNALDNSIEGNSGENILIGGDGSDYLIGNDGADSLVGGDGLDSLDGGSGNDSCFGGVGNDVIWSRDGDDLIDGGAGADTMLGGLGNDSYYIDDVSDVVTEIADEGTDTVFSSITKTLGSNLENLTLIGAANINATGNSLANVLTGNSGNNTLNGGSGADTMHGGAGNDLYIVDTGDTTIELAGGGTDTAQSAISWTLAAEVENVTLTGTSAINATGNSQGNTLTGNSAANILTGGAGNDLYVVGLGDTTIELAGGGTDTVQSAIAWTLADEVENLTLTGSTAINATGNSLDNTLTGNSGINVLTGGAGNDLYVAGTGDTTIELAGGGTDTVQTAIAWTLAAEVENLTLTGTSAVNGTGNASNNTLTGNSAANTLSGAAGDDQYGYNLGGGADRIIETIGNDRIVFGAGITSGQVTATRTGSVVKLIVNGTDSISIDQISAGVYAVEQFEFADNSVLGAAWVTALIPSAAPSASNLNAAEAYTEDTAKNLVDIVVADTDSANLTVTLTLSNSAAGSLNTATAAAVTSTYNAATGVWSASGAIANVNTLLAALTFTPAANFNGNFSIATSVSDGVTPAITGSKAFTGTAVNDAPSGTVTITGTPTQGQTLTAANSLADVDGLGTITYQWRAAGVAIAGATASTFLLTAAEVGKAITVSASYTDGKGTAESKTSSATAAVAVGPIMGTAGADTINGTTGADQMAGLAGNDTYLVNNAGDGVIENLNEGTDLVNASVTHTLAANVENITLTGTTAINATGNGLDNTLTGNGGINVLTGLAGNDLYVVGTGDTTIEAANAGTDSVQSAIAWTLANNVENLTLTGTAAVNGTGNTGANVLTGNSGANTLTGNAGADTLRGLAGLDSLIGGTGNDTYWLDRGYGADSITENDATAGNTDIARFEAGIAVAQLWFTKTGNNLDVSIIGTADKFTLTNWYLGTQYRVEQFKTSDGKTLLDTQVQNLVDAMAAYTPPPLGQTVLLVGVATALESVFAANWI